MDQLSNKELIINHTIFHAYFCHLIEMDQVDCVKDLCKISSKLEDEINIRSISFSQIEECIKKADLEPQDRMMVNEYIFRDLIDYKIGNS